LVKEKIDNEQRKFVIRAGEIRWCSIGVNVGEEIDDKGVSFARPVIVVEKVGNQTALVVPMTTKLKNFPGYIPFTYKEKEMRLCVNHLKSISQKRLLKRKGRISNKRLQEVKDEIKKFYNL